LTPTPPNTVSTLGTLPRQHPLLLSTLNRLPLVQDIALQIVHDLGFKTKRAEFVLSPLSFTTSRKIIITPYSYASTCNLSAVTPCICAPTCKPSNGHSFNFPFLNIKRRLFPPFQLPPLTISSLPCIRLTLHSSFSPPNILLNRHFLPPGTSSFLLSNSTPAFSGSLYWSLIHCLCLCTVF